MTGRDRIVVIVAGALILLGAAWILAVSPERKRASQVQAKVESARSQLSEAETKLAEAQLAQRRYAAAYASIVSLGAAVPADREVPSLVYVLDHASTRDKVNFESIAASSAGSSASSASSTATPVSGGFQQLPFTFSFEGGFEDLYKLLGRLQGFTVSTPNGSVDVNGRLLSIQGVTLAPNTASGSVSTLKATVTATAYVLPAGQSLTAGATAAAPAGASPASSSGAAAAPATPAVVRPLP